MGSGQQGTRFLDENHPCALDLDLFGSASLFERICTARTGRGEDVLADWLRLPAGVEAVRQRQDAIAELRPRLELREQLALLADSVPPGVDLESLVSWGSAPPVAMPNGARLTAITCGGGELLLVTVCGLELPPFEPMSPHSAATALAGCASASAWALATFGQSPSAAGLKQKNSPNLVISRR